MNAQIDQFEEDMEFFVDKWEKSIAEVDTLIEIEVGTESTGID